MRAALDPNGADAYWAGRFGLIPLPYGPITDVSRRIFASRVTQGRPTGMT